MVPVASARGCSPPGATTLESSVPSENLSAPERYLLMRATHSVCSFSSSQTERVAGRETKSTFGRPSTRALPFAG